MNNMATYMQLRREYMTIVAKKACRGRNAALLELQDAILVTEKQYGILPCSDELLKLFIVMLQSNTNWGCNVLQGKLYEIISELNQLIVTDVIAGDITQC